MGSVCLPISVHCWFMVASEMKETHAWLSSGYLEAILGEFMLKLSIWSASQQLGAYVTQFWLICNLGFCTQTHATDSAAWTIHCRQVQSIRSSPYRILGVSVWESFQWEGQWDRLEPSPLCLLLGYKECFSPPLDITHCVTVLPSVLMTSLGHSLPSEWLRLISQWSNHCHYSLPR